MQRPTAAAAPDAAARLSLAAPPDSSKQPAQHQALGAGGLTAAAQTTAGATSAAAAHFSLSARNQTIKVVQCRDKCYAAASEAIECCCECFTSRSARKQNCGIRRAPAKHGAQLCASCVADMCRMWHRTMAQPHRPASAPVCSRCTSVQQCAACCATRVAGGTDACNQTKSLSGLDSVLQTSARRWTAAPAAARPTIGWFKIAELRCVSAQIPPA